MKIRELLVILLFIQNLYADIDCEGSHKEVCQSLQITNEEINNVCNNIIKKQNSLNEMWIHQIGNDKIEDFDINNDGVNENNIVFYSGTMRNPGVSYKLSDGKLTMPHQMNFEWKYYWNKYISFVKVHDKVYSYNEDTHPVHLSIITPKNEEYSLCSFSNKITKKLIPNQKIERANEICTAIEHDDKSVKYITFNTTPKMSETEFKNLKHWRETMGKTANVDYDNNGEKSKLLSIYYANTSTGIGFEYFDELTDNEIEFKKSDTVSILLKMQGLYANPSLGSRFFQYKGKTYYEYINGDNRKILIMVNNKVDTVCQQETTVVTTVN